MRLLNLIIPLTVVSFQVAIAAEDSASAGSVSASAVIAEINRARENPALYATCLEELRFHYSGNFLVLSGHTKIHTKEGLRAVDEAIRFLRSTKPLQPLVLSPGMCKAAADHCADQAGGGFGHGGSGWSNPARRMNRYGVWSASWGENISYGKATARDIVLQLIIDDGLSSRKHRKNIFNPNFNFAGAAYGAHARYGSVCNIDFAGAYVERDSALVARNY